MQRPGAPAGSNTVRMGAPPGIAAWDPGTRCPAAEGVPFARGVLPQEEEEPPRRPGESPHASVWELSRELG